MINDNLIKSLIGLTEDAAKRLADGKFSLQVVKKDNEVYMSDMMFDSTRIKIEIKDGIILNAKLG